MKISIRLERNFRVENQPKSYDGETPDNNSLRVWIGKRFFPCTVLPAPLVMFALSFVLYVLAVLPILLKNGGLFFYYGDYNVQQVPFYILAHRAVRSGQFFWNFGLDLGGPLTGDLAFYLTGSPFFWITLLFSEKLVPYMFPYLMALKYATGATLAYLYIRRFTFGRKEVNRCLEQESGRAAFLQHETSARIGGLLYAFSGFNACNIVFNHFTDAVCFFPLLLIAFDDLMDSSATEDCFRFKKGYLPWLRFSLVVTLLAVINYFFFFGMVVFLLIYACVRYIRHNYFRVLPIMFLRALTAGVAGMLMAAFFLVMAMTGLAGNTRLSNVLTGYTLICYPDAKMYFDILKSMIMTPDIIGRGTLFYTATVKNSSLAFYLPMFGLTGVAGYLHMARGRRDWKKRLLYVCLLVALIPGLNAMFSLFNTQYYARWFFMPILFAALVTALVLDRGKQNDLRFGVIVQSVLFLFMVLVFFLPSTTEEGNVVMFNMSENTKYFRLDALVTFALTLSSLLAIFLLRKKLMRCRVLYAMTALACTIMTMNVLYKGDAIINDRGMRMWKVQMLDSKPELPERDVFFRAEADGTSTNYEMVWGYPTIHCFLSTVPAEIFDFYYGAAGIKRSVESEPKLDREGLRALLSARYFIWNSDINDDGEYGKNEGTYGYDEIVYEGNGFTVFENKNFIPMGFTFAYFMRESFFDTLSKDAHDRLLVKALILSDEDANQYGELMTEMAQANLTENISDAEFDELCEERAKSACDEFEVLESGFRAVTSDLERDSLVFFSVPNTPGFSVRVDGKEIDPVTADYGLMAVPVPKGVHEITAVYTPYGFQNGLMISLIGLVSVACFGVMSFCFDRGRKRMESQ